MQTILKDNIMNSGFSNDEVFSGVFRDDTSTLSHPPAVATSQEKLDSGIGSECSHGNRMKHVVQSRETKPDVQELECLFTAGRVSAFVYEHSLTGEARTRLVPVVGVSLVQPAFNSTRRTDCNTVQISCFDLSLAKCKSTARNSGECPVQTRNLAQLQRFLVCTHLTPHLYTTLCHLTSPPSHLTPPPLSLGPFFPTLPHYLLTQFTPTSISPTLSSLRPNYV